MQRDDVYSCGALFSLGPDTNVHYGMAHAKAILLPWLERFATAGNPDRDGDQSFCTLTNALAAQIRHPILSYDQMGRHFERLSQPSPGRVRTRFSIQSPWLPLREGRQWIFPPNRAACTSDEMYLPAYSTELVAADHLGIHLTHKIDLQGQS